MNSSLHANASSKNLFEVSPKNYHKHYINPNLVLHQFLNIFSDYESSFQVVDNPLQLTDYIKCLDSTPVYFTFNCGVLYIPNKSKIWLNLPLDMNSGSEFDIFSYQGDVSSGYLKFLAKIGKVFSLNDNPHIYLGGLDRNGSHGKYSIYHQDVLFQVKY